MAAVDQAATSALAQLREEFPLFEIWVDRTGEHARYVARRLHQGTTPHTLVTADLAELRTVLNDSQPGVLPDSQCRATDDEYPQAIADDYPGWGIRCDGGRWTGWCPAVTVHADSAAGLRAAIEQAITGDAPG